MNNQLIPVPFYSDTVVLVEHQNQPYVAMRPVVNNMGLAWQVQHRKMVDKFGSTITIMVTVGEDGKSREMVCLPLRKLPAWLLKGNTVRKFLRIGPVRSAVSERHARGKGPKQRMPETFRCWIFRA